ncbi:MauE/DoxX family redox-associated membrane protein [Ferruginibacter sp.]
MKKTELINYSNSLTCYLLIFLFTYTGITKLIDHSIFKSSILQSSIISNYATVISLSIPLLELSIVVMLVFEKYRQKGFLFSLLLMAAFTIYITYMILFIPHLPCSCGGILKELSWSNHLLFNSFVILLILVSLLSQNKHKLFIAINRTSRKPV